MDPTPRLYLFLSVDVVDSTKRKYEKPKDPQFNWIQEISNFYESFPVELNAAIDGLKQKYKIINSVGASIWKFSGDEILFYVEIKETNQIPAIIEAFANTLLEFNENKKPKPETNRPKLGLKGTAWTGQVPYLDMEFEKEGKKDFLGTSIDCGFRLGKFASIYELIISLEITKLCSECSLFTQPIIYLRREKLKGVLGSFSYPLFAITVSENRTENNFLHICHKDNIKSYMISIMKEKELKKYKDKILLIESDIPKYLKSHEPDSLQAVEKYKTIKLFSNDSNGIDAKVDTSIPNNIGYQDIKKALNVLSKNK